MTRNVLLLAHRIPYPPDKGDKIRSYHLLRHLARRHRVFLGAFVDDPHDLRHAGEVERLCAGTHLRPIDSRLRRIASLRGLASGEALSLPYYRDAAMQRWVDETIARERIDAVVVYSSTMSQYVDAPRHAGLVRIADFVDVDSDKWAQYARRSSGARAWVYARESRTLLAYERRVAAAFDATLFVSPAEADLFRTLAPECADRVSHYQNGVDTEYFDPSRPATNPYAAGGPVLAFTGAMDYWPNVEAVTWFADEVLPALRSRRPDVRFAIVGSNPTDAVKALAARDGVIVTGRVPDVRPYLAHAAVAVAPLRIARGIQNKVLEALAMARPLVCTSAAAEGLRACAEIADATADGAQAFTDRVLARLAAGAMPAHRALVLGHYSWDSHLARVDALLDASLKGPDALSSQLGSAVSDAASAIRPDAESKRAIKVPALRARLIVYSSLFPSSAAPTSGTFIRERAFRVARHIPTVIVAPQAWSPFDVAIRMFRKGFRPRAPAHEVMDGIDVYRPRFLSVPGALKRMDGWLMAASTQAIVSRIHESFRATSIDAHFLYPDGWAATRIGAKLGLPVSVTLRGSKDALLIGTDRERFLREAMNASARLFSVSDSLRADVASRLGVVPDRLRVIGNGVDLVKFTPVDRRTARARLGIAPEARVAIGVGGLVRGKGFHRVIELMPELLARIPDFVYLIVGGGASHEDMRDELEAQARALGVESSVRLCGRQLPEDLKWYYGAANVFALATAYEGWANVFLEAMACGLPVVTTRVGGNEEVVCSQAVGTLVDYWDPQAFAVALVDSFEREWNREAILRYAASNSWDARVAQLIAEYESMAEGNLNGSSHAIDCVSSTAGDLTIRGSTAIGVQTDITEESAR